MNNWIVSICLALSSTTALANYTQLSLGLGANTQFYTDGDNATATSTTTLSNGRYQTRFMPSLIDTVHFTFSKHWDWQIGLQYMFAPKADAEIHSLTNVEGTDVYIHDQIHALSHIILINTGFGFHMGSAFDINVFGGVGASENRAGGDDNSASSPTGPFEYYGTFRNKYVWRTAWDFGADMNYHLSNQWALGLRYQFVNSGSAKTGTGLPNDNANDYVKFKLHRHVYLATLSYIFNRTGSSL